MKVFFKNEFEIVLFVFLDKFIFELISFEKNVWDVGKKEIFFWFNVS